MSAKILVVDDEPDVEALVLQRFRRQIRDGAVTFLFAHDGLEALSTIAENRDIDMVLSDINMPRMDGLSLLQKLQEADDKLSTVIVSAYGDMGNIRTAMNRGAFDFITKPIDFLDLETTIDRTVRHVAHTREAKRRLLMQNGRTRRCAGISRPILHSSLPLAPRMSTSSANGERLPRYSPTSPGSRLWSRRWIQRSSPHC
jgi:DNA-binding NtrC family response regulator